ncbi:MAG: chemotaxis-specific protein-glutamate methyltransferase CheB, partial [Hyphomicrobiales bacterium]|nr:chemotaxis-specific protein-glutamate methyltransferase CheB [Hyphomicrobiales bacterium]
SQARTMIKRLNPDVLTLDIEMPGLNGLDFLEKIMTLRPMPVVMISSLTEKRAAASIKALSIGAFECLPKPVMSDDQALQHMCDVVKLAAKSSAAMAGNLNGAHWTSGKKPTLKADSGGPDLVLIGSSTGGVEALGTILTSFPANCPPTVVTQHIPEKFAASLSVRLDGVCAPKISLAEDGKILTPGNVYIAPGTIGHLTVTRATHIRSRITRGTAVNGHMPSVDQLFESAANYSMGDISAALLTGMGKDGAEGLLKLKNAGAHTIAQDEKSSVVYGMPAAAVRIGAVREILPLNRIAKSLLEKKSEKTNVNL